MFCLERQRGEIAVVSDPWESKLFFEEFDNKKSVTKSNWSHSCLRSETIKEEVGAHHNITVVRLYEERYNLATGVLLHHAFVVFKTEGSWKYSLGKNSRGIKLQRSKCLSDVVHQAWEGVADTKEEKGQGSIDEVLHYLWTHGCLRHRHATGSGCSGFARALFQHFSFHGREDYYYQDDTGF